MVRSREHDWNKHNKWEHGLRETRGKEDILRYVIGHKVDKYDKGKLVMNTEVEIQ